MENGALYNENQAGKVPLRIAHWPCLIPQDDDDDNNEQKFLDEQRQNAHADLLRGELLKLNDADEDGSDDELLLGTTEYGRCVTGVIWVRRFPKRTCRTMRNTEPTWTF